jgi:DNA-binding IclR family transcriptional regulator
MGYETMNSPFCAGIISPVFEAGGQVAFVMGLSGFTQMFRGTETRRARLRLREACDRVTTFITRRPPRS